MLTEAFVDAAASLIGLEILPEHRPGVIRNFTLLMLQANLFMEFPLDDRVEMGPAFHP